MADREQADTAKRETEQKPQRDFSGTVGRSHRREDNLAKDSEQRVKPGGTIGRDVPGESKEHHTEVAVEAGRREQRQHKR